jgi:hypothetical protein
MSEYDKDSAVFIMTAPCGIDCAACECARAADNPAVMVYLISRGIDASKLPCPGCRDVAGMCPAIGEECETYRCVREKEVDFCFDCAGFPCDKLTPAADRANILPHNLKVYNLCVIQNRGLKEFTERSADIKERYYKGKMAVGKGPQTE